MNNKCEWLKTYQRMLECPSFIRTHPFYLNDNSIAFITFITIVKRFDNQFMIFVKTVTTHYWASKYLPIKLSLLQTVLYQS